MSPYPLLAAISLRIPWEGAFQELEAQELEAVAGGVIEMPTAEPNTVWQHIPVRQPDGTIEHTYHEILPPCPHCGGR